MDKVTRQCPQTTTFLKRKESRSGIEPRSFRKPSLRLTARPNRLTWFESRQNSFLYPAWTRLMFTYVLGRYFASSLIITYYPSLSEGADSVGEQLRENK